MCAPHLLLGSVEDDSRHLHPLPPADRRLLAGAQCRVAPRAISALGRSPVTSATGGVHPASVPVLAGLDRAVRAGRLSLGRGGDRRNRRGECDRGSDHNGLQSSVRHGQFLSDRLTPKISKSSMSRLFHRRAHQYSCSAAILMSPSLRILKLTVHVVL